MERRIDFAGLLERHSMHIIAVTIAVTCLFVTLIPTLEFNTDIDKFFPENDAIQARDRIEDNYGNDDMFHYVYLTPSNRTGSIDEDGSVFALPALEEQLEIIREVEKLNNLPEYRGMEPITSSISAASFLLILLEENGKESFGECENWGEIWDMIENYSDESSSAQADLDFASNLLLPKERDDFEISGDQEDRNDTPMVPSTLIIFTVNSNNLTIEERKIVANEIRETIEDMELRTVKTGHAGQDVLAYDVDKASNDVLIKLGATIFILIIVILYVFFKRWSYVFAPLLTLIIAIIWTLASIVLLKLEFTAIDVAVVPLIIGMGIDSSVHLTRRYQEELKKGHSIAKALEKTTFSIGGALFLAALTTVIAFLSNAISDVRPVRDFGIICALGIIYAFTLTLTFHSAIRYVLDKNLEKKLGRDAVIIHYTSQRDANKMDIAMGKASLFLRRHAPVVIVLMLIITSAAAYGSTKIRKDFSIEDFLPEDFDVLKVTDNIKADFTGASYTTCYLLIEPGEGAGANGGVATVDSLRLTDSFIQEATDDEYVLSFDEGVPRIESILTTMGKAIDGNDSLAENFSFEKVDRDGYHVWLPMENAVDSNVSEFIDYLLANHSIISKFTNTTFSEECSTFIHRTILGNDPVGTGITYRYEAALVRIYLSKPAPTGDDGGSSGSDTAQITNEDSKKIRRDLKNDLAAAKKKNFTSASAYNYYITGQVILLVETTESLQESQVSSTVISVVIAFVILVLVFRLSHRMKFSKSVLMGMITILPVILTVIWILGTMASTTALNNAGITIVPDISLNVLTVTVTALSIGLGIDYAIHVVERFREDMKKLKDADRAVTSMMENTGSSLFISAITTVAGFGVLIFSPMPLTQTFGLITAATILFGLIGATLIMPVFLIMLEKRMAGGEPDEKTEEEVLFEFPDGVDERKDEKKFDEKTGKKDEKRTEEKVEKMDEKKNEKKDDKKFKKQVKDRKEEGETEEDSDDDIEEISGDEIEDIYVTETPEGDVFEAGSVPDVPEDAVPVDAIPEKSGKPGVKSGKPGDRTAKTGKPSKPGKSVKTGRPVKRRKPARPPRPKPETEVVLQVSKKKPARGREETAPDEEETSIPAANGIQDTEIIEGDEGEVVIDLRPRHVDEEEVEEETEEAMD